MTTLTPKKTCNCRQSGGLTIGHVAMMLLSALIGAGVRHALDGPKFDALGAGLQEIGDQLDRVCKPRQVLVRGPKKAVPANPSNFKRVLQKDTVESETPSDIVTRKLDLTKN